MMDALKQHWPEYLMETLELGIFMVLALAFAVGIFHPASPVAYLSGGLKRILMGLAIGLTAIGIVYSPLGKRSGAHLNPALTLTFYRLGKIRGWDTVFYILAHFAGGLAGIAVMSALFFDWVSAPEVNYIATTPGMHAALTALFAEITIAFILMTCVLNMSNVKRLNRFTGLFVGALLVLFVVFESPFSGMSLNPARTFASTVFAHTWKFLWVYFAAPLAGMMLAAEVYVRQKGAHKVFCAKLHHENPARCIFRCNYGQCV